MVDSFFHGVGHFQIFFTMFDEKSEHTERFADHHGLHPAIGNHEREGSTGPSRGEHRLAVYRAHASQMGLSKTGVNGSEK